MKRFPIHANVKPFNGMPRMAVKTGSSNSGPEKRKQVLKQPQKRQSPHKPSIGSQNLPTSSRTLQTRKRPPQHDANAALPVVTNKRQCQRLVNESTVLSDNSQQRLEDLANDWIRMSKTNTEPRKKKTKATEPRQQQSSQIGYFHSERIDIPEPGPSKMSASISRMVQKQRQSLMGPNDKPIEIDLDAVKERTKKTVVRKLDKVPRTVEAYRNVNAGYIDEEKPAEEQYVNLEKMVQYNCSNPLKFASNLFGAILEQSNDLKKLCSNVNEQYSELHEDNSENFRNRKGERLNLPVKFQKFDSSAQIKVYDYEELLEFETWVENLPPGENQRHCRKRVKCIKSNYRRYLKHLNSCVDNVVDNSC